MKQGEQRWAKEPNVNSVFLQRKLLVLKRKRADEEEIRKPKENRQFPVLFADSTDTSDEEEKAELIPPSEHITAAINTPNDYLCEINISIVMN